MQLRKPEPVSQPPSTRPNRLTVRFQPLISGNRETRQQVSAIQRLTSLLPYPNRCSAIGNFDEPTDSLFRGRCPCMFTDSAVRCLSPCGQDLALHSLYHGDLVQLYEPPEIQMSCLGWPEVDTKSYLGTEANKDYSVVNPAKSAADHTRGQGKK
ncbi:hypothetical protein BJX64DRAFT_184455 [Aspergillus heterothallicus]